MKNIKVGDPYFLFMEENYSIHKHLYKQCLEELYDACVELDINELEWGMIEFDEKYNRLTVAEKLNIVKEINERLRKIAYGI